MANTYTLISSVTVGSGGQSAIEFTSIPQTYTDLLIKTSIRSNRATVVADFIKLSFNGSSANQSSMDLYGGGTASFSGTQSIIYGGLVSSGDATASVFSNGEIYIPNYTSSNNKPVSTDSVSENNGGESYVYLNAGLWSVGSAITSISITPNTGTLLNQHSTAYLYGISNA